MKKLVKVFSLIIACLTLVSLFAGCTKDNGSSSVDNSSSNIASESTTSTENTASETTVELQPVTLKFALNSGNIANEKFKGMIEAVNYALSDKKIKVEPLVIPGTGQEATNKILVGLMAGDEMDVVIMNTSSAISFANANVLTPLDSIMQESGYSADKVFGGNLSKHNDKIYFLPYSKGIHITLYNKTVFDNAGIAYPNPDTFTWDEYVETAKKLTDSKKEVFGSFMVDWDVYPSLIARVNKVADYKADGTSNFDDPGWAKSFKFYEDLGNVLKVQPSLVDIKSRKISITEFWNAQPKYGMLVVGDWGLSTSGARETYPREWKIGVLPIPKNSNGERVTLGMLTGLSVCSTTKHAKEAFEVVKWVAENEWSLPLGGIPARADLTEEQIQTICSKIAKTLEKDEIKPEEIKKALFDPQIQIVNEKVFGPGSTAIINLIQENAVLISTKQMSLEDAMKDLKNKADVAIKSDKTQK